MDDPHELQEQMDTLPYISRCNYSHLGMCVINMFMPLATQFQQLCAQGVANDQLAVVEGKYLPCTWAY